MDLSSARSPRRRAGHGRSGAVFVVGLLALAAAGCGVTLGSGEQETEVFTSLSVQGSFRPGGDLVLGLRYEQPYPVALDIECQLLTLEPLTPTPEPEETPVRSRARPPTPTPVPIPNPEPTPANKVLDILSETIGPNAQGGPVSEATPTLGSIRRRFTAPDKAGRYAVRCFTPADENNQIVRRIRLVEPE